mmetsp:Transcript_26625/g.62151  ORF Transcript_26625/g.62151 Transcript_26625/m.62151 type:complete len:105 (-) Transcript_26625:189-503(-)
MEAAAKKCWGAEQAAFDQEMLAWQQQHLPRRRRLALLALVLLILVATKLRQRLGRPLFRLFPGMILTTLVQQREQAVGHIFQRAFEICEGLIAGRACDLDTIPL